MIVVTVGTQLPFDRLIQMVDEIAPNVEEQFFAQTGLGSYQPRNIEWSANVAPKTFDDLLSKSSAIVAHAGIGTVLKAYRYVKPIILIPRIARLGEHRNDHQLATISQLRARPGIYTAENKEELLALVSGSLSPATSTDDIERSKYELQTFVRQTIDQALKGARQ